MTPQTGEKSFDVMKWLREIRDRHYEETKDMSWEERCEWYSRRPTDPVLARLFDRRKAPEGARVRTQAADERGVVVKDWDGLVLNCLDAVVDLPLKP